MKARTFQTTITVGTDLPEVGDLILARSEPDTRDGLPIYDVQRTVDAVQLVVTVYDVGGGELEQLRDRIEDLRNVISAQIVAEDIEKKENT